VKKEKENPAVPKTSWDLPPGDSNVVEKDAR